MPLLPASRYIISLHDFLSSFRGSERLDYGKCSGIQVHHEPIFACMLSDVAIVKPEMSKSYCVLGHCNQLQVDSEMWFDCCRSTIGALPESAKLSRMPSIFIVLIVMSAKVSRSSFLQKKHSKPFVQQLVKGTRWFDHFDLVAARDYLSAIAIGRIWSLRLESTYWCLYLRNVQLEDWHAGCQGMFLSSVKDTLLCTYHLCECTVWTGNYTLRRSWDVKLPSRAISWTTFTSRKPEWQHVFQSCIEYSKEAHLQRNKPQATLNLAARMSSQASNLHHRLWWDLHLLRGHKSVDLSILWWLGATFHLTLVLALQFCRICESAAHKILPPPAVKTFETA